MNIKKRLIELTLIKLSLAVIILSCVVFTITEKPSYDYLKSVTVEISGKASPEFILEETKKMQLDNVGIRWGGTGIVILKTKAYTYILTNAHVAGRGMEDVELQVKDGDCYVPAKLVKMSSKNDLAVLQIEGDLPEKRQIKGYSTTKPQDAVYVVGHHLGRAYTYGEGVMAGYENKNIIIQVPVLWGNSGSGVFNKNGKLVGLVFSISIRQIGMFPVIDMAHGIAVKIDDIKDFIDEYVY
jgi:S1-C subfamily serine protease